MFPRLNLRSGSAAAALLLLLLPAAARAQGWPRILEGADLERVVPQGFYFEGQSAATQMRNAAAAQLGPKRFVMAGLVDTAGYSTDVQAKYQGFIVTDSPVTVGGARLPTGAYGFGFTPNGRLNVFDVGGRRVLSVRAQSDERLQRPRPLMMADARGSVRLYAGRSFVVISK
ncbi:MAG: hypothetical protein JOZ02_00850 [Acidobacteria bacterium]|nr:hypothetical protein [Acidobacteriota bacterium]